VQYLRLAHLTAECAHHTYRKPLIVEFHYDPAYLQSLLSDALLHEDRVHKDQTNVSITVEILKAWHSLCCPFSTLSELRLDLILFI